MKFKNAIEVQAALKDSIGLAGATQEVLTSTGGGVEWTSIDKLSGAQASRVYYPVKNSSGVTITKGTAVMAVGTDGNSGHILVGPMEANGTVESMFYIGVLPFDLTNGATGISIYFGEVSSIDTSSYANGDILWCDPFNPGQFITTEPAGPSLKLAAGIVLNSAVNGKIFVRFDGNEGIHDLHDTRILSQISGDILVWNSGASVWMNDSTLNVDYTNDRIGIGTTAPATKLHLAGVSGEMLRIADSSASGSPMLSLYQTSTRRSYIQHADSGDNLSLASEYGGITLQTGTGGTEVERMRITSDGNAGIGTTSVASSRLTINGGALPTADNGSVNSLQFSGGVTGRRAGSNTVGFIGTYANSSSIEISSGFFGAGLSMHGSSASANAGSLILYTGSMESMRIDVSGNVGINNASPDPSALLDVNSTTQGFLPPRMTKGERDSISSPATGLMIYNTEDATVDVYDGGSGWRSLAWM